MYASCKRILKSKNFCFLDLNLACFGIRGPPWKIFIRKIVTCENKSCSTIISEQLCQKTFLSHLLSFRDKGGPNFQRKCTNFGILGPKEAPRRSKNLKNGLGTPDYPYLDPWPGSLFPKRAARSIKVSGPLLPTKSGSEAHVHRFPPRQGRESGKVSK